MTRASAATLIVLMAGPAAAQSQDTELRRRIEALEKALEEQSRELEELRRLLAQESPAPIPPAATQPAPTTAAESRAAQRTAELPPDQLAASEFPGSFPIPNSDAALRIGGLVRVNWVSTNNSLLVDDRFVTSAIPVEGTAEADKGSRVTVMARPSRFNFDLRTPTGVGHMRAFIEGDFGGSGNTLRLRHAYGQWHRVIYGQTWSTFSDPEAEPDGIDFEGLNAIVLFRQAQVRWTFAPADQIRLAVALEDPQPDLTGAAGVNQVPDFIGRVRWEPKIGGHLQAAGLLRQIRGAPPDRPNDVVSATGWGMTISGRLPSPFWRERDNLLFQHNQGSGIGRYITDLSAEGGQDGIYDPVLDEMRTLRALSGYIGYEHWWSQSLRSSLSAGIVRVNNLTIQTDDALHMTRRYSTNLIWSPIPRLDLVAELLWGLRINRDERRGRANQTQIGGTFRF
jgi:hypothetical protein